MSESKTQIRFVRLQTPGVFDYLRDLLRREPVCFPCHDSPGGCDLRRAVYGWSGNAEWYCDVGPGCNVALLCGSHKAEYEASLMCNALPYTEETELYIFEPAGPFLNASSAGPPSLAERGRR